MPAKKFGTDEEWTSGAAILALNGQRKQNVPAVTRHARARCVFADRIVVMDKVEEKNTSLANKMATQMAVGLARQEFIDSFVAMVRGEEDEPNV